QDRPASLGLSPVALGRLGLHGRSGRSDRGARDGGAGTPPRAGDRRRLGGALAPPAGVARRLPTARVLGDRSGEHRRARHLGDGAPAAPPLPGSPRAGRSETLTGGLAARALRHLVARGLLLARDAHLLRGAGRLAGARRRRPLRMGRLRRMGGGADRGDRAALLGDRQGVPPDRPPRRSSSGAGRESGQRLSAAPTAFTTSCSLGNPVSPFSATTFPFTATSKMPPLPGRRSASTPSDFLSSAAARVARGR